MLAFPDESARLREDTALPCPDVQGTELHRAGGVEKPAVTRVQDSEAGPSQRRVQGEGPAATVYTSGEHCPMCSEAAPVPAMAPENGESGDR